MDNAEILKHIDHTLLKAVSDEKGILDICKEAVEHKTASVCIPPSYVKLAKEKFPSLNVCTVIGFPLGYSTTAVKVFGSFDKVTEEISAVRKAAEGKILKVIIETCYLTEEEKIRLCKCVTDGGADYIKTSTGFGTAGAQKEDIVLFKNNIGKNVKIKAAGGIRTKEAMEEFIELGCDRIGTSGANLLF